MMHVDPATFTAGCLATHTGVWAVQPERLRDALKLVFSGQWPKADSREREPQGQAAAGGKPYFMSGDIAMIGVRGFMMKGDSKFGGTTNTVAVRRQLRAAREDPDVSGVMLVVDSGGGTAAGTDELAADVRALRTRKPVHAYVDDCACSAAYWTASQASRLTVNSTGLVGSIGTVAVVEDTSESASNQGVRVHVIATGALKGQGMEGAPVSEEYLDEMRRIVELTQTAFDAAVRSGRGMSASKLAEVRTGAVWVGAEAVGLGLVDAVGNLDTAMRDLAADVTRRRDARRRSAQARSVEADLVSDTR